MPITNNQSDNILSVSTLFFFENKRTPKKNDNTIPIFNTNVILNYLIIIRVFIYVIHQNNFLKIRLIAILFTRRKNGKYKKSSRLRASILLSYRKLKLTTTLEFTTTTPIFNILCELPFFHLI